MRLRDLIDLVANLPPDLNLDLFSASPDDAEEIEALAEAKPKGSLDAEQWRKRSERQKGVARKKNDEVARHARRMRDLATQSAKP